MRKTLRILACLTLVLSYSSLAKAAGFDSLTYRPATDLASYFNIWSPKTLKAFDWEAATSVYFAYHPLQLFQNGARQRGVINDLFVQDFTGSIGIIDKWLELGIDLPVVWVNTFTDPNLAVASQSTKTALGDLDIHLKSDLYNSDSGIYRVGLLSTLATPTGSQKYYLGDRTVGFTEKLLLEATPTKRWSFALNFGFDIRPDEQLRNIKADNQLVWGAAAQYNPLERLQLLAEVDTRAQLSSPYSDEANSPTEAIIGAKYLFKDSGFVVNGGVGFGLVYGSDVPLTRVFAGLSYSPRLKQDQEDRRTITDTVVHFDSNQSKIDQPEVKKLEVVAKVLKKHPGDKVMITGYTDSSGKAKLNDKLSVNRALSVSRSLQNSGICTCRLKTKGKGSANPVADNATPSGRKKNRRSTLSLNPDYLLSNH